jgi:EAL domain-containing protein (putative c-di-GMP-specific phosphodiesterase class I)
MELFLHTTDNEDPEIIEVEATASVRSLLVEDDPDGGVWIEEVDEEIDLDLTLEVAGIQHRHHVHRGRCRHVEVIVRWNGDHKHTFGPSRTIKTVEKWAFGPEVANFSKEQAAKHVLAVPGADHFLDPGVHIGSLTSPGECSVTLDLLPRSRFEG